jgi:hypothetical protein
MANTVESGFSPVRQFDPYTRPRLARWPIPGRLSQCLLQPVHVWLTAKLGADVPGLYRTVQSLAAAKFIHPPRPGSMIDPATPASVRVRAAEAIFNHAAKAIEIEDIEARVAALEAGTASGGPRR